MARPKRDPNTSSPKKLTDGRVMWASKRFPTMIFTDTMLDVFKEAYPFVKLFQPELKKAEAWLMANPDRVPKSQFGRFINSWMRIANDQAARQGQTNWSERYQQKEYPQEHRAKADAPQDFNLADFMSAFKLHTESTSKQPPDQQGEQR